MGESAEATAYLSRLGAKWERVAVLDPLWAVWTTPLKKGGKWQRDEFFRAGQREVSQLMADLARRGIEFPRRNALDFGCGVGRLTRPLGRLFGKVLGLDISPTMVAQAQQFSARDENVSYAVNGTAGLAAVPDKCCDFVITMHTLQHMAPALMESYLSDFVRVLRPEGLCYFQLPSTRLADGQDSERWGALGTDEDEDGYPRMDMFGIEFGKVCAFIAGVGGSVTASWPDRSVRGWDSYCYCVRRNDD